MQSWDARSSIRSLFSEGRISYSTVIGGKPHLHNHPGGVSGALVAKRLGLHRSTITRRVRQAIDIGYLRDKATTKGRPAMLVINDPLSDEVELLPSAAAV